MVSFDELLPGKRDVWSRRKVRDYRSAAYSHTGRPSIDPVLMIRMLIVGYVFALRSERRLCAEVQVNLAYRWFCKCCISLAASMFGLSPCCHGC